MIRLIHVLLFFVIGVSTAASAQSSIPCPKPKVGTTFQYSVKEYSQVSTDIISINRVDDQTIEGTLNDRPLLFDKALNPLKEWGGARLETKMYLLPECPFNLGQQYEYSNVRYLSAMGTDFVLRIRITPDEKLTTLKTPAGEFSVIRVVSSINARYSNTRASGSGTMSRILHYAPDLGIFVRMEFTSTTDRSSKIHELVSVK